jgi:hypothetical protein
MGDHFPLPIPPNHDDPPTPRVKLSIRMSVMPQPVKWWGGGDKNTVLAVWYMGKGESLQDQPRSASHHPRGQVTKEVLCWRPNGSTIFAPSHRGTRNSAHCVPTIRLRDCLTRRLFEQCGSQNLFFSTRALWAKRGNSRGERAGQCGRKLCTDISCFL